MRRGASLHVARWHEPGSAFLGYHGADSDALAIYKYANTTATWLDRG